jgi:hypothetical protein
VKEQPSKVNLTLIGDSNGIEFMVEVCRENDMKLCYGCGSFNDREETV